MYGYWEIYVCCWEDGRGEERGGAAVAEMLSSWFAEQKDRGSIPGFTT